MIVNSAAKMKIAIEGCCHGCLDTIYDVLVAVQEREGYKIDLLICCGDFEALRNEEDLCCMAVPPKYREMGSFYKYYSGEKKAPVLTLFIGGNHEASNYLWELSYGGWVAPNIYYLGSVGVVKYGGLRIAGLSGIYKSHHFNLNHYEQPPYNGDTMRSTYHIRSCDVFRLKQLSGHVDIALSHDWPQGIYHYGNKQQLVRFKPHFEEQISRDDLGSPPTMDLLDKLKPSYWFSAHLHVKFSALCPHDKGYTKFLALDKCLPKRRFLQILDFATPPEVTPPYTLEYDAEWLTILSLTEPLMKYTRGYWSTPSPLTHQRWQFTPTSQEIEDLKDKFGDMNIPDNFVASVTPYSQGAKVNQRAVVHAHENGQTKELCKRLGIDNPFRPPHDDSLVTTTVHNPDEIDLESSDSEREEATIVERMDTTSLGDGRGKSKIEDETAMVGCTKEGVVWSIENRPGLRLPDPTLPPNELREEVPFPGQSAFQPEVQVSQEHSRKELSGEASPKAGPVIKRRNQALYTAVEDDND